MVDDRDIRLADGEDLDQCDPPVVAPKQRPAVAVPLVRLTVWSDGTTTAEWPGSGEAHTFAPLIGGM